MTTDEKFTTLAHYTCNSRKLVLCVTLDPSSESGNFWIQFCTWEELKCPALNQLLIFVDVLAG